MVNEVVVRGSRQKQVNKSLPQWLQGAWQMRIIDHTFRKLVATPYGI